MIREENINCTLEALIISSPEPVSVKRLCEVVEGISPARIRQGIDDLNNLYLGCGGSFRIRELAGGFQMYVLPDFEQSVKRLLSRERTVRLSQAALETLAIIAYKQPATKTEIEHIRGVASDGVLHNLLQRRLIAIAGRSEGVGRPLLYRTSAEFLKFFGLNRLSDLPRIDEIEELIRQSEPSKTQTVLPLPEMADAAALSGVDEEPLEGGADNVAGLTGIDDVTDEGEEGEDRRFAAESADDIPLGEEEIPAEEAESLDEDSEALVTDDGTDPEKRPSPWAKIFAVDETDDTVIAAVPEPLTQPGPEPDESDQPREITLDAEQDSAAGGRVDAPEM